MASIGDLSSNSPIRRTADDLETDLVQALKNFANNAPFDWPNEAGVRCYHHIRTMKDTITNQKCSQFANLTEHRGPIELPVKGTIPTWTAGSLFRNGPGAPGRKIENTRSSLSGRKDGVVVLDHWFDGFAHLHRFDIVPSEQGVKVIYSSRSQSEEFIEAVQKNGSFGEIVSFGQRADPCVGIFSKVTSCFKAASNQDNEAMKYDNMNVTVQPGLQVPGLFPRGGHKGAKKPIWLASDTTGLRAVDPATLAPLGTASQSSLHPSLKGAMSCAHAQRCPKTGDYFNYNIEAGPKTIYRIFRVSAATGKTTILATVSHLPMAYIHSFFLSERFVILRIPVSHIGKMGLSTVWKRNLVEAIEPFDSTKKCKWVVVDRLHGQGVVAEFETPAAFFFHTVNSWDEVSGDDAEFADVFCDVIDFPNTNVITMMYFDFLLKTDRHALEEKIRNEKIVKSWFSSLIRWKFRVPLPRPKTSASKKTKTNKPGKLAEPKVVLEVKAPHAGDLPTINPAFHTLPYRYLYSLPNNGKSTFLDTIVKTDTVTREILQWNNPAGHTPGEAIFVPRPRQDGDVGQGEGEEEDDGVLLSVVLDGFSRKSYLVCIDAKTMVEMGRAEMDFAVGEGLHGMHVMTE